MCSIVNLQLISMSCTVYHCVCVFDVHHERPTLAAYPTFIDPRQDQVQQQVQRQVREGENVPGRLRVTT